MALSPGLADWLVQRGHDAVHASAVGLARAPDADIIHRARDEHRTIITADLDYPRLLALARSERPGLILFRGGNYSDREVIERLAHALDLTPDEHLSTSLIVIERWRIRKRHLPIKPH
jgi:predicted nuclease of predicted toxin-antitoxin system